MQFNKGKKIVDQFNGGAQVTVRRAGDGRMRYFIVEGVIFQIPLAHLPDGHASRRWHTP